VTQRPWLLFYLTFWWQRGKRGGASEFVMESGLVWMSWSSLGNRQGGAASSWAELEEAVLSLPSSAFSDSGWDFKLVLVGGFTPRCYQLGLPFPL
jgi:hypothetical protein